MTGLSRFDFYPRDWHLDTRDLGNEAKGVYVDLLAAMYARGAPLPMDETELCRLTGCKSVRSLRRPLRELLDTGKLRLVDGRLVNNRAMEELAKAEATRANGRKGGKSRSSDLSAENPEFTAGKSGKLPAKTEENQRDNPKLPSPSPSPSKKENEIGGGNSPDYAWEGRVIRLRRQDYDRWKAIYSNIRHFDAELQAADDYYAEKPPAEGKWFFPVSNWLKRENNKPHNASDAVDWDSSREYLGVL